MRLVAVTRWSTGKGYISTCIERLQRPLTELAEPCDTPYSLAVSVILIFLLTLSYSTPHLARQPTCSGRGQHAPHA